MTHEEALMYLHGMLLGAQKARSISIESWGDMPDGISKFLFGPGNVVPKLIEIVNRAEQGAPIYGADFYNLMIIANQLEPSIGMCAVNFGVSLPNPDSKWVTEVWQ